MTHYKNYAAYDEHRLSRDVIIAHIRKSLNLSEHLSSVLADYLMLTFEYPYSHKAQDIIIKRAHRAFGLNARTQYIFKRMS